MNFLEVLKSGNEGFDVTTTLKKNLDTLIFEKLKDELIAGRWTPGQQISIDEVADQYGVSRTPVIHAVKMLAAEGIFTFRRNGRVEVPLFSAKQIEDICRMRALLEDFAVRTICENGDVSVLDAVFEIARECEVQTRVHNNMIEARKMDLQLHRQIIKAAGSDCLLSGYIMVQGQFTTANHLFVTHSDASQLFSCDEHMKILTNLRDFNYRATVKILNRHIMDGCKRILQHMSQMRAAEKT